MKININTSFLFLLILLSSSFMWYSCGNNNSSGSDSPQEDETTQTDHTGDEGEPPPESMSTLKASEQVYAWVDRLNIREKPELGGKVVASATEQQALEFTGEKSNATETIVLRGVAYDEPWLKVKTGDGKEGWVFGGAVKRKDETKGNEPMNNERFFFPHFGRFDLATWEKISSKDESGGDAEVTVSTYTKGGRTLEITQADVGEYGYSWNYVLKENNGTVLKTRDFNFEGDGMNLLIEKVNVYTSDPPRQYLREQQLNLHYMQLNARPVMAFGAWKEGAAE